MSQASDILNALEKLVEAFTASDRVQVVTVNIEPAYVFKKFAKRLSQFQIFLAYDPEKNGRRTYGVEGVPHMIIVGKHGHIDTVCIGY